MTNNICERHNRELKTMCNTNTTVPEFLNKIIHYHKNQDQLWIQKIANLKLRSKKQICAQGTPDAVVKDLQQLMPLITNKAVILILNEIEILVVNKDQNIITDFVVYFVGADGSKHS